MSKTRAATKRYAEYQVITSGNKETGAEYEIESLTDDDASKTKGSKVRKLPRIQINIQLEEESDSEEEGQEEGKKDDQESSEDNEESTKVKPTMTLRSAEVDIPNKTNSPSRVLTRSKTKSPSQ